MTNTEKGYMDMICKNCSIGLMYIMESNFKYLKCESCGFCKVNPKPLISGILIKVK